MGDKEIKPAIESLWIILTVMIPGIVFYGTFRVLVAVLEINIPFLATLDEVETLFIAVLFAIMFILQFFGIVLEDIAFKIGPYKHTKALKRNSWQSPKDLQDAFDNKYRIIALIDPDENVHVERCLAQFFMSHNIAVGMGINLLWVIIYEFFVLCRFDTITVPTFVILLATTLAACWVPYTRFHNSSKMLYTCYQHLKEEGKELPEYAGVAPSTKGRLRKFSEFLRKFVFWN